MKHTVEEVKLKCGAKGLLIDVPDAPVFCMEIWFRAGDAYTEGGKKIETAHAMEHLGYGANAEHGSMSEVSRFVSKNGAYKNAHTNRRHLWYTIQCPDFDFERLLRYLVMQISTPKFLQKEFDSELNTIEEEFRSRSNNRWAELECMMSQRFGWDFNETDRERLELMYNVELSDVIRHYKKTHSAKNATFFIAGNLSQKRAQIEAELENLEKLNEGEKLLLPAQPKISGFPSNPVVIKKKEVENVSFSLDCYADFKLSDNETINDISARLNTLNVILTHSFHSRIFGKARAMGLVYHVDSDREIYNDDSCLWSVYAEIGQKKVSDFIDLLVDELREVIKNGVTKQEVKEATNEIRGSLRMANQTTKSILAYYRVRYNFTENGTVRGDMSDLEAEYSRVNKDNIQNAFLNLIKSKKWGAGFLGNVTEEDAKKWNAKLAEIFEDDTKN